MKKNEGEKKMKKTRKLKRILADVAAIAAMTALLSTTAMAAKDNSWTEDTILGDGSNNIYLSPDRIDDGYSSSSQDYSDVYPALRIIEERTEHDYIKGSGAEVTITCNGEYSRFRSVYVDGVLLENTHYTVKEGSTVLTLMPEYLDTLSVGAHTVTLKYTYGSVDSILNIMENTSNSEDASNSASGTDQTSRNASAGNGAAPKTGDTSPIMFGSIAALISGCSYIIFARRKRADEE